MIIDVNQQRIDSNFVELFIINDAYFTSYPTNVTFRDYEPPYTLRTYTSVPMEFSGAEQRSEGAYARPRLSVANILDTFKDAIGLSSDELIGKKLTRRRTLLKRLSSGSDSSPPTESPIQIYYIDRKESENAQVITFELAAPFDLAGIKVPSRNIIPNTCSWVFQGAASDSTNSRMGGCSWKVASNNNGFPVFLDSRNNLFITGISPPTHNQVSAFTKDYIYAVSGNRNRVNLNNTISSVSRPDYFQAKLTSSGPLDGSNARRCIPYTTYNSGTTYYVYREGYLYADHVLHNNRIWRCIRTHSSQTPKAGEYWVRADVCGKKLSSCSARFGSISTSAQFSNIPTTSADLSKVLPYGGFPAARRFTR
jgi:lambda family phage minor tail protein L